MGFVGGHEPSVFPTMHQTMGQRCRVYPQCRCGNHL